MQFCKHLIFAAILAFSGAVIAPSQAAVITYTATGQMSGSISGRPFSGPFVAKAVADTATKSACPSPTGIIPNCSVLLNNSLEFQITGLGRFSFLNLTYSLMNYNTGLFVIGEVLSASPLAARDVLLLNVSGTGYDTSASLANYDLVSNLGPVTTNTVVVPSFTPSFGAFLPFQTDKGPVFVPAPSRAASTFTAQLAIAAVPEPDSWVMLILGFGLVGLLTRSKTKLRPAAPLQ